MVRIRNNESVDILPKEYSVQSKVHEYGGGAASICIDGSLLCSAGDNGVFRLLPSGDVKSIVPSNEKLRYADFDPSPSDNIALAVQEDHTTDNVENRLVVIDTTNGEVRCISSGADFYAHPRFSHDGKWISWIQWNHPDMPWTGTELYVAQWLDGMPGESKLVAGKPRTESIIHANWHSYGGLMFASDKTGFQQLYMYDPTASEIRRLPVAGFEDADLARASPKLGM